MRLLLVEDEPEIADMMQVILRKDNYVVDIAHTSAFAREAILGIDYALVIFDRRLPDGDGLDLVKYARTQSKPCRFLAVSALADLDDKICGLNAGADDYIVKPFDEYEFLARVRAVLRRPGEEAPAIWRCGELEVHKKLRTVTIRGKNIIFSRRELSLIEVLVKFAGRVATRQQIEAAVYGYDDMIRPNAIETHISRVRKILAQNNAGISIRTIRGIGYMMDKD